MPIMASQGQSDARGTAQILASMALDCISNPARAPEERVALNNVYRLLESFRTNLLFGFEPAIPPSNVRSPQRLTLKRPLERHVRDVRDALEEARRAAFGDRDKDEALSVIENVLRSLAYARPEPTQISENDRNATARFFEALVGRLQNV